MFKLSDFILTAQASAADKNYLSDEETPVPERIPIPPEIERMIRKAAEASPLWPYYSDEHRAALEDFEANHFGLNPDADGSGPSFSEVSSDPVFDRFGFFDQRPQGILTQAARKGAFQNFILAELDAALEQVREEAQNEDLKIGISESAKRMIFDDLIKTLDENGADSAWLQELKFIDFPIYFKDFGEKSVEYVVDKNGEKKKVVTGGFTIPYAGGYAIIMNAHKFSKYSPKMKTELLHELRHVWQHYQEFWKSKFRNEMNPKTDMSVEVDAYEKQHLLEKILGVKATFRRNFFDELERENLKPAKKQYRKAYRLFHFEGYEEKGKYRLRTPDEYEQEFGE